MKMKLIKVLGLAASLFCGNALADPTGDIWEILPCTSDGTVVPASERSTRDNSIAVGKTFYFKVRMIARYDTATATYGTQWHCEPAWSSGSSEYSKALNPPRICIYISGVKAYADLVGSIPASEVGNEFTDFIFAYTVKAGDFALPVVFGTKDGPVGPEVTEMPEYYFDPLTASNWKFVSELTVSGVAETQTAHWWFYEGDPAERGHTPPLTETKDFSLTDASFYLRTVDFDATWETTTAWRSVHMDDTAVSGTRDPMLQVVGNATEGRTLYVWSTNEAAVVVAKGRDEKGNYVEPFKVKMRVGGTNYEPVYTNYWVAPVYVIGEEIPFLIKGVMSNEVSQLVLSPYSNFNWKATSGTLLTNDFVTVPVNCCEPLAPEIRIVPSIKTVTAGPDYMQKVTELEVYFRRAYSKDVTFTIKPQFEKTVEGTDTRDWRDYIRVAANETELSTLAGKTNLTFTIPANQTVPMEDGVVQRIYLFALRGDENTTGIYHLQFEATPKDTSVKADIKGFDERQGDLTINPTAPTVEQDPSMSTNATAGVAKQLSIFVEDGMYADMANTNGYEVYVVTNATKSMTYAKLDGTYKPDSTKDNKLVKVGADGKLTDELPSITYTSADIGEVSTIFRVKSTISDRTTDITITMTIAEPVGFYIYACDDELNIIKKTKYYEGEEQGSGNFMFYFANGYKHYGSDIYLFLEPLDTASSNAIECTCLVGGEGLEISKLGGGSEDDPIIGSFVMVDGKNSNNSAFKYKARLRTAQAWADGKDVAEYGAKNTLVLNTFNIEPEVESVNLDANNTAEEEWANIVVAKNVQQTFQANMYEPGKYDLKATGKEAFQVRWKFTKGSSHYADNADEDGIIYGNPENDASKAQFTFTSAGTWKVTVQARDKDQQEASVNWTKIKEYTFNITVVDQPMIHVTGSYGRGTSSDVTRTTFTEIESMDESTTDENAYIHIALDYNKCDFDMTLKLVVTPPSTSDSDNPGILTLQTSTSVKKGEKDNEYLVTIPAEVTDVWIPVKTLDGTPLTLSTGFSFEPSITAPHEVVPGSGGKYADEGYYAPYTGNRAIKVQNEAPQIEFISPEPSTNVISVAIGTVEEAITFGFTDVTNDFGKSVNENKGIKVRFVGGGGCETNFTSKAEANKWGSAGWKPTFTASGLQTVRLYIMDNDNGSATYNGRALEWHYQVETSKNMTMVPHGPGSGNGTTLSTKYGNAGGLGQGRVWAEGDSGVVGFEHTVNCKLAKSIKVYGYGYKKDDVDGKGAEQKLHYPDGTLGYYTGRDVAINGAGNSEFTDGAFTYAGNLDSFLYAWFLNVREENGTFTTTLLNNTIKPEKSQEKDTGSLVSLPTEADEDGSYDVTMVEAIFSKEFYASDNMGDINHDGIPDAYYSKYWLESDSSTSTDTEETTTIDDLTKLAANNDDEDMLPGLLDAAVSASGTVSNGVAFKALWEIRGFGNGLNNAPDIAGLKDVKPDRIYEDPAISTNSTLSKVEYLAWMEYKAAHPTATVNDWSPENPTDPTVADTDEDGFTDGYEYYYWYRAHVGYINAAGAHEYMTGRKFDPRNPGYGIKISSEEIAEAMNPTVAASAETLYNDADNDGLPDLLEFQIGTNPFDFDTDGDGLPDGWEVMYAATSPLTQYTTIDIHDSLRNNDCDAMAITSPVLEKDVSPTPFHIEKYTTFAVIAEDGDSDGVQWYATKKSDLITLSEEPATDKSLYIITAADGKVYGTKAQPHKTDGGRLATAMKGYLLAATNVTAEAGIAKEGEGEGEGETKYIIQLPVSLSAGMAVTDVGAEATAVWYFTIAADVKGKDGLHAAWIYGRDNAYDARLGVFPASAAYFGCLALARPLDVAAGAIVCAMPSEERDVALLHYMVYQEFGFDPRTAWAIESPFADRWGEKSADGTAYSGVEASGAGAYTGLPTRSRKYTAYDEFLVMSFFLNNGALGDEVIVPTKSYTWRDIFARLTTNPRGPNESSGVAVTVDVAGGTISAGNSDLDDNGADTDADGVPDGWELYVMAGPKDKKTGGFVFAPPYAGFKNGNAKEMAVSYFSPFLDYASDEATTNPSLFDDGNVMYNVPGTKKVKEELTELREFSGTDSCAVYTNVCTTILAREAQIKGAGDGRYTVDDSKWLNKFLPTDPWNKDTDGDGVSDSEEADYFIYGTPADNGSRAIPGGGMNPVSVDTDTDGLPDRWEAQFSFTTSGKYAFTEQESGKSGNHANGITNCMDGTVSDAYTKPGEVNRDYDYDGLENWQEYLVGTMRCWRYDDPVGSWGQIPKQSYCKLVDGVWVFDAEHATKTLLGDEATVGEFWYRTLVDRESPIYNPHLVFDSNPASEFFSAVKNPWDAAFLNDGKNNTKGYAYYWFHDRVGDTQLAEAWASRLGDAAMNPLIYASCSPINNDTDQDGMDDYYELFHGMNPLLGETGINTLSRNPCDIVSDSYGLVFQAWGANANYWVVNVQGRGSGYDFTVFPWLNGAAGADPDGDDIPNQTESIMAQVANTGYHTDPTPLWMTDASYTNSLTYRFFRLPTRYVQAELTEESFTFDAGDGEKTYYFRDFEGYDDSGDKPRISAFVPDSWKLAADGEPNWICSFEENEGYDSDHDIVSDNSEIRGQYGSATDPLDADSPKRRQAMWFPGDKAVLQTMPEAREYHPVGAVDYPNDPSFTTFTVECWVKPEAAMLTGEHTILERTSFVNPTKAADQEYVRRNFVVGVKDGHWYGKFDPEGTYTLNEVKVLSSMLATTSWTHLALTYDANYLILYVNGAEAGRQQASSVPEHGVYAMSSYLTLDETSGIYARNMPHDWSFVAILVGASLKSQLEFDASFKPTDAEALEKCVGQALNVTKGAGWNYYKNYFGGYVDEIRIWDGARDATAIANDKDVRYTQAMALANRQEVYDQWSIGLYRYTKGATGVVPELRYHFHFDSVPAADNAAMVAKSPNGFMSTAVMMERPEGYAIDWWQTALKGESSSNAAFTGYTGTIYSNPAWVQWIPNTMAHLPRHDGTTLDSQFWAEDSAGATIDSFVVQGTAEPVSRWSQYFRNGVGSSEDYWTTAWRYHFVAGETDRTRYTDYEFTARHINRLGDDLIPLGGTFAKYVDSATGMWDGEGASTAWEVTGATDSLEGLPDWWKDYASDTHGWDGSELTWDTIVDYRYTGELMTAGKAYQRDLAAGVYADNNGYYVDGDGKYVQTADANRNGIPDWWENMFNVVDADVNSDPDDDGLTTYQEYCVWRDDLLGDNQMLDPMSKWSSANQLDYFRRMPNGWYLGEYLADHDFMEDTWEDVYFSAVNRNVYDGHKDPDLDGWSNYAEAMADTNPSVESQLLFEGNEHAQYPVPTIPLRLSGVSAEKLSAKPLIVRAVQDGNVEAQWSISDTKGTKTKFLGYNPGNSITMMLSPGSIEPGSVQIEMKDPTGNVETYAMVTNGATPAKKLIQSLKISTGEAQWTTVAVDSQPDPSSEIGQLVDRKDGTTVLGYVNYRTGEAMVDMTYLGGEWRTWTDDLTAMVTFMSKSYTQVTWKSKLPTSGEYLDVYISDADAGHLREKTYDFVAFSDTDGNGEFTAGEPLGVVRNVSVGWKSTPQYAIELSQQTTAKRFAIGVDAGKRLCVVRTAINGEALRIARTVYAKTYQTSGTNLFTEANLIREGAYDFDWSYLMADAKRAGISNVLSATYEIRRTGTNGLETVDTLTESFTGEYVAPMPCNADTNGTCKVLTARPSLTWTDNSGFSAFALQVARDVAFSDVVYATTNFMPAAVGGVRAFKPLIYVGDELNDGTRYYWRVAGLNAKYTTNVWSCVASFETRVDSADFGTGYGKLAADVRYYGPSTTPINQVVVGVFETPDFTGEPVARKHLVGEGPISTLANDTTKAFSTATANVTFDGLAAGDYYVMAYVDVNMNGTREAYESWGYVCNVGTEITPRWQPVVVSVDPTVATVPTCIVAMEDTDVNQNELPDCLEDMSNWLAADSDGDGICDDDEQTKYGTDPFKADTDGDGLTDYEEIFEYFSDPTLADTDSDGMSDGREAAIGSDPNTEDADVDADCDGLTNAQECDAFERLGLEIRADNPMSDGVTPDYFRIGTKSVKYAGEFYNGGEWMDQTGRGALLDSGTARQGTKDTFSVGWDNWSIVGNNNAYSDETSSHSLMVSYALKYMTIRYGTKFTGTTEDDIIQYHNNNYPHSTMTAGGVSVVSVCSSAEEVLKHMLGSQTGDSYTNEQLLERVKEAINEAGVSKLQASGYDIPTPSVDLALRYAGNIAATVKIEAYQVSSSYPEKGEQCIAEWSKSAQFDSGYITLRLGSADAGSLKQGKTRFVAYIDEDGDSKLSPADTMGETTVTVGYRGGSVEIRLGEQNAALPVLRMSDGTNSYSTIALVRSAINGQPLYNAAKGVFIMQFPNNAAREALYPAEYVTPDHVGIDKSLATDYTADELALIESVTYEVLRLKADEVAGLNVTRLNNYLYQDTNGEWQVANTASNETFTINYSLSRDVADAIAVAGNTADDITLSFTVPTDSANMRFWLYVKSSEGLKVYGGEKGFLLMYAADGTVTLDSAWLDAHGVSLPTGTIEFAVALGNDKYGKPAVEPVRYATTVINKARVYDGQIALKIQHALPSVSFAEGLTVAAYTQDDLAEPFTCAVNKGDGLFMLTGLRPGVNYYVAAWYVKNVKDGRADATERRPYDTWGYVAALGEQTHAFNALAIEATDETPAVTNLLYLQDTDWNDNGVLDREEDFTTADGTYSRTIVPAYNFDIEGVDESELFSDATKQEVFAYAKVPYTLVASEVDGIVTWYAVTKPEDETVDIVNGTTLSQIKSLYSTYYYDTGSANPSRLALGTNVVGSASLKVTDVATTELIIVHAQVYDRYGFSPLTANGVVDASARVNTKAFTSSDKNYVTNYLANVLGVVNASQYALPEDYYDADPVEGGRGDGIPDGWELYTMFGPSGTRIVAAGELENGTTIHSPWHFADRDYDLDNDGLKFLNEYDNGDTPTDPWDVDSDHDGIIDQYAYAYHLKNGQAAEDFDGDGLSNYAEYLISEVFQYEKLDPDNAKTDGYCTDYFKKFGNLYYGEVFSDHDQVDDAWERQYASAANASVYDPDRDDDGDGWSNWAEAMAGTDPTAEASLGVDGLERKEYPVPVVKATVVYNGSDALNGSIVFKAWSEEESDARTARTAKQNATWTFAAAEEAEALAEASKYIGKKPSILRTYNLGPTQISEGSFKAYFKNLNYTVGSVKGAAYVSASAGASSAANWYCDITDRDGKLYESTTGAQVGTIDYATGETSIDFASEALNGTIIGSSENIESGDSSNVSTNSSGTVVAFSLEGAHVKFAWSAKAVGRSPTGTYYLTDPDTTALDLQRLREGKTTFVAYVTSESEGDDGTQPFVPGKPYGVVRGVDVGWDGASFTIELSDVSPITARISLWEDDTSDRGTHYKDLNDAIEVPDPRTLPYNPFTNNIVAASAADKGSSLRVRVARYTVNNGFTTMLCNWAGFSDNIVLDKTFNETGRTLLEEGDFLADDSFDLDWAGLGTMAKSQGVKDACGATGQYADIAQMTYLVVVGDGKAEFEAFDDTNTTITAFSQVIERRFEIVRHRPVATQGEQMQYGARPTFSWSIPDEEAYAKKFGSSYTAFRLQFTSDPTFQTIVYDSGVLRAPAADGNGLFTWTAPACVGDLMPGTGRLFANNTKYYWRVSMYNAKFNDTTNPYWSTAGDGVPGVFVTAVNDQSALNDHQYSSVGVAVKYTGHPDVLQRVESFEETYGNKKTAQDDLQRCQGKVHVQAFATADFRGEPLASCVATNAIADAADITANAKLAGLAVPGTYYLRAFIDMNGNGEKDTFESWGAAKAPVVFTATDLTPSTVGLYIEDADTDCDWLPDAYEFALVNDEHNGEKGKLWELDWSDITAVYTADVTTDNSVFVTRKLIKQMLATNVTAGVSSGMPGASLSIFQNEVFIGALLGLSTSSRTMWEAVNASVKLKVVPNTVKVTNMTLDPENNKVILTVGADVDYADPIAGDIVNKTYEITTATSAKVTVKVYRKNTILDAQWQLVKTISDVTIGTSDAKVVVDLKTTLDTSSGFYKVEIEQ